MARYGEDARMRVDYQSSYVAIDETASEFPSEKESRRAVSVSMLPIKKIMPSEKLFTIIKPNIRMLLGS